eukprot:3016882-Pyramimonas_sp.AAC.1
MFFRVFSALASEASLMYCEERCATEELYEVPGGNLVDGLPPVPSLPYALRVLDQVCVCPLLSGFWTLPSGR